MDVRTYIYWHVHIDATANKLIYYAGGGGNSTGRWSAVRSQGSTQVRPQIQLSRCHQSSGQLWQPSQDGQVARQPEPFPVKGGRTPPTHLFFC